MKFSVVLIRFLFGLIFLIATNAYAVDVKLKMLTHLAGLEDNPLVGYGLVTGLAGTGDSSRSKETIQSISNMLKQFNINISPSDINSRNVAAVMITANLPPFAHQGDKLDVTVSAMGDAKSLVGGILLATPLKASDGHIYVMAQGSVSVGGYKYDMFGNVVQKNHPTTGIVSSGGVVEKSIDEAFFKSNQPLLLILNHPDFTTASRIESAINKTFGKNTAVAQTPSSIEVNVPKGAHMISFISQLESLSITPDKTPIVVVNERTGTIVSGGDVKLDAVTISQGDLQITIKTDYTASQPWLVRQTGEGVRTAILPHTDINADEKNATAVTLAEGASVADLINALSQVQTSTRDVISVLESLKRSGALHAELVVQ